MVYDVVKAVNSLPKEQQIPVIGLGGISKWQDAVEFIMAGASAIQVGTATTRTKMRMNTALIIPFKSFMLLPRKF